MNGALIGRLVASVTLAAMAAGCSNSAAGNAQPQDSTTAGSAEPSEPVDSSSSASAGGPLASVDPCSLLPPEDAAQLGFGAGEHDDVGTSRGCEFKIDANDGAAVDVVIFEDVGIDDVVSHRKIRHFSIGTHDAAESMGRGGVCAVTLAVTESSRVDVQGSNRSADEAQACALARRAAKLVEPNLP